MFIVYSNILLKYIGFIFPFSFFALLLVCYLKGYIYLAFVYCVKTKYMNMYSLHISPLVLCLFTGGLSKRIHTLSYCPLCKNNIILMYMAFLFLFWFFALLLGGCLIWNITLAFVNCEKKKYCINIFSYIFM